MRNIFKKFNINITTYIFFLFSFLCGYFKNAIYIFIIVFIHELGHILVIKLFKYNIIKVEFFPFGGITKIDKPLNSSINKEIIISISGILSQCILSLFINNSLFQFYNICILLFNLIPIIPLDGSILVHSILEKYFSFELSYTIYQVISWIFFFLFLFINYYYNFNNYFICVVLIFQFYIINKQKRYILNRFYLERYLKEYPYRKIENHRNKNIHVLKKEVRHFFYYEDCYLNEREMLGDYFEFV